MAFRKILILTDLSAEAARAFAPAAAVSARLGATLTLLHVVYDPAIPSDAPYGAPHVVPDIGGLVANAKKGLAEHLAQLPPAAQARSELIASQVAADAVVEFARRNGYDLIVLSSHGRSGFRRLVMGSVAEAIVRKSHVPVLVIPRAE